MSLKFTLSGHERSFDALYQRLRSIVQEENNDMLVVKCTDPSYRHETDEMNSVHMEVTSYAPDTVSVMDALFPIRPDTYAPFGTFMFDSVWQNESSVGGVAECYVAASHDKNIMLEMKQNHHFPILGSRRIFGDCVVFLID